MGFEQRPEGSPGPEGREAEVSEGPVEVEVGQARLYSTGLDPKPWEQGPTLNFPTYETEAMQPSSLSSQIMNRKSSDMWGRI